MPLRTQQALVLPMLHTPPVLLPALLSRKPIAVQGGIDGAALGKANGAAYRDRLSNQMHGRLGNKPQTPPGTQGHPYQGCIWHQNFPILHPDEGNYPKWTGVVSGLSALEVGGTEQ